MDGSWEQSAAWRKEWLKPLGSVQVWGCFGNNGEDGCPAVHVDKAVRPQHGPFVTDDSPSRSRPAAEAGPQGTRDDVRNGERRPHQACQTAPEEKGRDGDTLRVQASPGGLGTGSVLFRMSQLLFPRLTFVLTFQSLARDVDFFS